MKLAECLTPNGRLSATFVPPAILTLVGLVLWQFLKPSIFPGPLEVLGALPSLWDDGLGSEVLVSLTANIEAVALSALIGLPLCYLSRTPILTPVAAFLAKLRFAGSAVFYLPLIMLLPSTHTVKIALLALANLFNLTSTMMQVVQDIPDERYDDASTLRMGPFQSLWYVNIRGTVPMALDSISSCAGSGWSMIMFVEGLLRSEGGVGVVLLTAEKHVEYGTYFAVITIVVLVGVGQDWLLAQTKRAMCPYIS